MGQGLRILVLVVVLLSALVTSGPGNRFFAHPTERVRVARGYAAAGGGVWFAVVAGSLLVPAPMLLFSEHNRALLAQHWFGAAALIPAPLVAFALARRVSPPWWKPWHAWIAMRAALLLVVVAGVEALAVRSGAPILAELPRIWLVSLIATAGYLACWRVLDTGYWPLLLIRDGATVLLIAAAVGWWQAAAGGPPAPAAAGTGQLAVTLLLLALAAIGGCAVSVGGWRLRRWLRHGPPFWPRPPGISNWPPEPGEVWNAVIIHDDGNHKDRPVLVWERQAHHANVLTITSVDKSSRPQQYVRLAPAEWEGVLTKAAWMSLQVTPVPYTDFRSLRGECPGPLWHRLERKNLVGEWPAGVPAPGLTFRHRLFAAMNRRAGKDARTLPAAPAPRRPAAPTPRRAGAGDRRQRGRSGARAAGRRGPGGG